MPTYLHASIQIESTVASHQFQAWHIMTMTHHWHNMHHHTLVPWFKWRVSRQTRVDHLRLRPCSTLRFFMFNVWAKDSAAASSSLWKPSALTIIWCAIPRKVVATCEIVWKWGMHVILREKTIINRWIWGVPQNFQTTNMFLDILSPFLPLQKKSMQWRTPQNLRLAWTTRDPGALRPRALDQAVKPLQMQPVPCGNQRKGRTITNITSPTNHDYSLGFNQHRHIQKINLGIYRCWNGTRQNKLRHPLQNHP